MEHWKRIYPADIYELDYDTLVTDPGSAVRPLLDFLGQPWDDACLAPSPLKAAIRTASAWQVRQPVHRRSSGRWRHYADRLGEIRAILAEAGIADLQTDA